MIDLSRELAVGLAAVRMASRLCTAVQAEIQPDALAKKDKSPVTIADYGSQALICRELAAAFPHDPIIAEEDAAELRGAGQQEFLMLIERHVNAVGITAQGEEICDWIDRGGSQEHAARFWTLDPIDGTKGFLRKEQFAVALALVINGEVVLGILGCPNLPLTPDGKEQAGSLFSAVKGGGAHVQSLLDDTVEALPIRVSQQTQPQAAQFCESVESGHSSHDTAAQIAEKLGLTQPPIRMDSQAKYGVVARGEADVYLRLPTRADYREKIWDHAAGVLVVTEAGGTVTDITGKPLEFTHGRELTANRGVIVTNGLLHDEVLAAVADVGIH